MSFSRSSLLNRSSGLLWTLFNSDNDADDDADDNDADADNDDDDNDDNDDDDNDDDDDNNKWYFRFLGKLIIEAI